jgi:hypothetical protein
MLAPLSGVQAKLFLVIICGVLGVRAYGFGGFFISSWWHARACKQCKPRG